MSENLCRMIESRCIARIIAPGGHHNVIIVLPAERYKYREYVKQQKKKKLKSATYDG